MSLEELQDLKVFLDATWPINWQIDQSGGSAVLGKEAALGISVEYRDDSYRVLGYLLNQMFFDREVGSIERLWDALDELYCLFLDLTMVTPLMFDDEDEEEDDGIYQPQSQSQPVTFIVRYTNLKEDWGKPGNMADLHIAERWAVPGLPEWRKMPYCRNGGMNLKNWRFVELDPMEVHSSRVCGSCRNRMVANGVLVRFKDS